MQIVGETECATKSFLPPPLPPSLLSLVNFGLVAYANDAVGLQRTHSCNHTLVGCENVYRARATTFATTTILLLIHAYNCKNLGTSLLKMDVSFSLDVLHFMYGLEGRSKGKKGHTYTQTFTHMHAHTFFRLLT